MFSLRSTFTSLLLFISCFALTAQSNKDGNKEVILYKDFLFLNTDTYYLLNYEPKLLNGLGMGVAVNKKKDERRFRQYEVKLALQKDDATNFQLLQLNYTRGKYWKKNLLKSVKIRHGYTTSIELFNEQTTPAASSEFPTSDAKIGVAVHYQIGLDIPIFQKINFHLDLYPISISSSYGRYRVNDPTIPLGSRVQWTSDFNIISQRVLKLGIGIAF